MLHLHNLLLPTDFSSCAERAFDHGLDLAARSGARVHLVHIETVTPTNGDDLGAYDALRLHAVVDAHLSRLPADLREGLDIVYETVRHAREADGLLDYAVRHAVDAIVLGTHGRRGVRHWLMGSVTETLIREAACPVLAVPRGAGQLGAPRRVLAPIDFSDASAQSLAQARYLAALYEAELDLLFVAEQRMVPTFQDTGLPTFTMLEPDPDVVARSQEALRRLDAQTLGPEVPTHYAMRYGVPHRVIPEYARQVGAGLVVMATSGLGGVGPGWLGSVTERVVRAAPCPVWTTRAQARKAGTARTTEARIEQP